MYIKNVANMSEDEEGMKVVEDRENINNLMWNITYLCQIMKKQTTWHTIPKNSVTNPFFTPSKKNLKP